MHPAPSRPRAAGPRDRHNACGHTGVWRVGHAKWRPALSNWAGNGRFSGSPNQCQSDAYVDSIYRHAWLVSIYLWWNQRSQTTPQMTSQTTPFPNMTICRDALDGFNPRPGFNPGLLPCVPSLVPLEPGFETYEQDNVGWGCNVAIVRECSICFHRAIWTCLLCVGAVSCMLCRPGRPWPQASAPPALLSSPLRRQCPICRIAVCAFLRSGHMMEMPQLSAANLGATASRQCGMDAGSLRFWLVTHTNAQLALARCNLGPAPASVCLFKLIFAF